MRHWPLLVAVFLLGCAHARTQVQRDEDYDFARLRRVAAVAFNDPKGQGRAIALAINAQLPGLMHEAVDMDAVQQILEPYKPDRDMGLGLEALELVRKKTSADALILGRMTPDWSAVLVTVVETELGDPVLRAVTKPRDKRKKAFDSVKEIAAAAMGVIAGQR